MKHFQLHCHSHINLVEIQIWGILYYCKKQITEGREEEGPIIYFSLIWNQCRVLAGGQNLAGSFHIWKTQAFNCV